MTTLRLECEQGEPGYLNWTVPMDAPDLLYYQVGCVVQCTSAITISDYLSYSVSPTGILDGVSTSSMLDNPHRRIGADQFRWASTMWFSC